MSVRNRRLTTPALPRCNLKGGLAPVEISSGLVERNLTQDTEKDGQSFGDDIFTSNVQSYIFRSTAPIAASPGFASDGDTTTEL